MLFLAELLDHRRPQTPDLGRVLKGGLNHNELRSRINADALAICADERELTSRSRKQPQEITIAEIRHSFVRRKIGVGGFYGCRVDHPLHRYDLFTFPRAVVGEQAPKPGVVAKNSIEAEMRQFKTLRVQQPCGIGSHTFWCR
jgi:hypothetical protein